MSDLQSILRDLQEGRMTEVEAAERISALTVLDLGHTRIDTDRKRRNGMSEVIFCEGKSLEQLQDIFRTVLKREGQILGTRLSKDRAHQLQAEFSELNYDAESRVARVGGQPLREDLCSSDILLAAGGTSDIPVAEEAAQSLEFFGFPLTRLYDVGVAGLHRLLQHQDKIRKARLIIAVAGMEGALPSVIAGLAACPVIAVPTSVGYGSHFEGLASLLAMLNSCASGVTVVNIDNGFGAAAAAVKIFNSLRAGDGEEAEAGSNKAAKAGPSLEEGQMG